MSEMHFCTISRKVAKKRGISSYISLKPCKHGHFPERKTSNGECRECARLYQSGKYKENPSYYNEKRKQYTLDNPGYSSAKSSEWKKRNKELVRHYNKSYQEKNRPRIASKRRAYHAENKAQRNEASRKWKRENEDAVREYDKKWRAQNPCIHRFYYSQKPEVFCARSALRRAQKLERSFPWLEDKVSEIYEEAASRRKTVKM